MNDALRTRLIALGVYPGPARDIARRFPDPTSTRAVLIAFRAHVKETDSVSIAVWRLQNGILFTGGGVIDNHFREPDPCYLHETGDTGEEVCETT